MCPFPVEDGLPLLNHCLMSPAFQHCLHLPHPLQCRSPQLSLHLLPTTTCPQVVTKKHLHHPIPVRDMMKTQKTIQIRWEGGSSTLGQELSVRIQFPIAGGSIRGKARKPQQLIHLRYILKIPKVSELVCFSNFSCSHYRRSVVEIIARHGRYPYSTGWLSLPTV